MILTPTEVLEEHKRAREESMARLSEEINRKLRHWTPEEGEICATIDSSWYEVIEEVVKTMEENGWKVKMVRPADSVHFQLTITAQGYDD